MKRKVTVTSGEITITATITPRKDRGLTRDEVQSVRDQVADSLMSVAANARYIGTHLNKIVVR